MASNDSFQQFLDTKQYCMKGVRRYEWIFGKTFLSAGGFATTQGVHSLAKTMVKKRTEIRITITSETWAESAKRRLRDRRPQFLHGRGVWSRSFGS
ncbi:hypothetical protein JTE90_002535 [Oedothorax gibbosus]|uniref:Uncharacterized protein n=1 Tax=Oedothorax gibbosus TaxID=931172 RepID=A0AAV6V4I2_9ARAC|nr:hypothetical protein JTE90_002535 [Oedothorax gibbosus]